MDKTIYARTKQKSACPYCTGSAITKEQSIAMTHKDVIDREWYYPFNDRDGKKPEYLARTSNESVWWYKIDVTTGATYIHTYQQRVYDKLPTKPSEKREKEYLLKSQ